VSILIILRIAQHSMQCAGLQEITLVTALLYHLQVLLHLEPALNHLLLLQHLPQHLLQHLFLLLVSAVLYYYFIITCYALGLQVFANDVRNTSVTLQWRTSNTLEVTYYNISYSAVISFKTERGDTVTYPVKKFMSATGSSSTIGPLNPSTTYTFTVTAYTRNGPGPSATITQRTDKGRIGNLIYIQLQRFVMLVAYLSMQKTHHSCKFVLLRLIIVIYGKR